MLFPNWAHLQVHQGDSGRIGTVYTESMEIVCSLGAGHIPITPTLRCQVAALLLFIALSLRVAVAPGDQTSALKHEGCLQGGCEHI